GDDDSAAELFAQTQEPGQCADLIELRMRSKRRQHVCTRFGRNCRGKSVQLSQAGSRVRSLEEQRSVELQVTPGQTMLERFGVTSQLRPSLAHKDDIVFLTDLQSSRRRLLSAKSI